MIRVESEETQDHVRESLNLSRRKISFVQRAISIPQRPMCCCDNRCSDKAFRFLQFASVVVEDGEEAHTVNLCQRKFNGTGPGWQAMENVGTDQCFCKECGSICLLKKRKRNSF